MDNKHLDIDFDQIKDNFDEFHPSDIADSLKKISKKDREKFYDILHKIPDEILGEVLLELPESLRDKAYKSLSNTQISQALEELETDDATDIIQDIEDLDEQKAKDILNSLDQEDQDDINWLKKYEEDEAGAYMQIELFSAHKSETIQDSINRLKMMKKNDEIENIHQVFIVDDGQILIGSIGLEDLLTFDFHFKYEDILKNDSENKYKPLSVVGDDDIDEVVK